MKVLIAIFLLAVIACNSAEKKEALSMPGAYNMLSQSIKGDSTDTTFTTLQQLKIFTGEHMMYANVNPSDSVSSFGVGTYSVSADGISEHVLFSAGDSSSDDTLRTYTLLIEKTPKGYKQIIPAIGTPPVKLTEEYESSGDSVSTALDGVWKLVSVTYIKGKDTVSDKRVQYKTYYAGQVAWGVSYADSLKKLHTGIGFGKFELNGTKLKESMKSSTFSDVRGHEFNIDIELSGPDGYTQTTINTDGSKNIEVYQRLKK
jgi:hypothetical protein